MFYNYNVRPYIILNGVDSRTIKGLLISELPPISKPGIRVQQEEIDGRDGDLITPLGYAAYDKVIKIGLTYDYVIDDIIEYFNGSGKVVFSNEPDKYYFYSIYNQIDFEKLIRFKTAEVTLHIQPFKFSDTENEQTFNLSGTSSEVSIRNNGNIYSRPTITITGSGDIDFLLNGSQLLTIGLGLNTQTIIINCTEMNAYNSQGILLNRLVSGDYDNIKLKVGNNTLSFIGNVTKVIVDDYSRWI